VDTIAACATPWGRGAIAVVRVSGPRCREIASCVAGPLPPPRRASLRRYVDAEGAIDEGLVTCFPGPRSYTGEDLCELSLHGNPLLVERLLAALSAAGARAARPGEFTRRAFLHGRVDLARAEAVLQAIDASSSRGLSVARAGLDGSVTSTSLALGRRCGEIAAELEAILDHPGEEYLFSGDDALSASMRAVAGELRGVAATYRAGRLAVEGARVAIVGPVNAGKSSLFNALVGAERALVSAVPGTTRDVVEARVSIGGISVLLLDTAGDRVAGDAIEAAGQALGARMRAEADLRVACVPLHVGGDGVDAEVVVGTFADLAAEGGGGPEIRVNAASGEGVEAVRQAIARALLGEEPGDARVVLASARQRDAFLRAAESVEEASSALFAAGPAVAAELLYAAIEALGGIGGTDAREQVLDQLFARFCVGK
jgi:tRNA modification GTPase